MKLKRQANFKGSEQDFPALLLASDNIKSYLQDLWDGKLKTLSFPAEITGLYGQTAYVGLTPAGRYKAFAKGDTVKITLRNKTVTYRRA
jgi:hypothetical protein